MPDGPAWVAWHCALMPLELKIRRQAMQPKAAVQAFVEMPGNVCVGM